MRVSHPYRTLQLELHPKRKKRECQMARCSMKNNNCTRKNVVYKMECVKCKASYIGCTIRELHQRVSEHMVREDSPVHLHTQKCKQATWRTTVLKTERDIIDLRISEAILISENSPSLNNREELRNMEPIIFR